jgi:hypothetical protein
VLEGAAGRVGEAKNNAESRSQKPKLVFLFLFFPSHSLPTLATVETNGLDLTSDLGLAVLE